MTFFKYNNDVLIWKGGERLKIGDGSGSTGRAEVVSVVDETSRTLLVSAFLQHSKIEPQLACYHVPIDSLNWEKQGCQ